MFYRFRIRHVEVLRRLAAYLSDNFCQEFIASEISRLFGISDHTAENYYSHLKEAYLLLGVPKFSYKSRERVRNEKVYVVDVAFVSEREGSFSTENLGWRLKNSNAKICYSSILMKTRKWKGMGILYNSFLQLNGW